MRDGPLLTLGTFLNCESFSIGEMDNDVSFMINTTVKYVVEGVRASEASLNTQKQFSEMIFLTGIYDLWTTPLHLRRCVERWIASVKILNHG
jgi:hypothetical protein